MLVLMWIIYWNYLYKLG